MSTTVGQSISDIISIRDLANVAVEGLLAGDFATLEAFAIDAPGTTALVDLTEIDEGEYRVRFTPSEPGPWAFHYVYDASPVFRERTRRYEVEPEAISVIILSSGGNWTYDPTDLADPVNIVRHELGDTDDSNPLLTDEEITYELGANPNRERAIVACFYAIAARYGTLADTSELDLSVKASQLADHFMALGKAYAASIVTSGRGTAVPFVGGISHGDSIMRDRDPDRVPTLFDRTTPGGYGNAYGRRRDWP